MLEDPVFACLKAWLLACSWIDIIHHNNSYLDVSRGVSLENCFEVARKLGRRIFIAAVFLERLCKFELCYA